MKNRLDLAIQRYEKAAARLDEGVSEARTELDRDGVIQRFEFTFELLWKCLKIYLEDKGFDYRSPKDCLKGAFRLGLLADEEDFLDMLEDRNKTSHLYSKEESRVIFDRILDRHLPHMLGLLERLKKSR